MTKRLVAVAAIVVLAAAGVYAWHVFGPSSGARGAASAHAVQYHCPMHPSIVSDKPGECPICHMTLVPMDSAKATPAAAPAKTRYRSTMNPGEVSDKPGKDSMGMEMVPVEPAETAPSGDTAAAGLATIRIPAYKQQMIGVETAEVGVEPFVRTIRTVGRVAADEKRMRQVHTKIAGYVETLYVNATGETVRAGQPLLSIYSPDLLASQQDYLVAAAAAKRTEGSALPSVAGSGAELLASARRRLELFDMDDADIRALESTGTARRDVTLRAPVSGTVLERSVTQGQRVDPDTTLLTIADLSRVWVLAAVYEYEAPFVRTGQRAVVTLSYLPGRSFEGRVAFVYPVLDPATRTIQVRVELDNTDGALRPDMYADVVLEADLGPRLSVPDTAVMRTGTRDLVFVAKGDGVFEPRRVHLGLQLPAQDEVLDGLAAGERVLTSANFFVDAESKLKAAMSAVPEPRN